jgi:hypothetical protein
MLRTVFAMAVAGLVLAVLPGTAQAAPIAPLAQGVTAELSDVTQISWTRCSRDRWGRRHCRRCWRNRWGRVRCR